MLDSSTTIVKPTRGGKRPGAGRKKGSITVGRFRTIGQIKSLSQIRRAFMDYVDEKQIQKLVKFTLEKAEVNSDILRFVMEQVFGKARQNIGVDGGDEGKALILHISEEIAKKNQLPSPDNNLLREATIIQNEKENIQGIHIE